MKNLLKRILDVMAEVESIEKTAKIKMGNNEYVAVEHDEVAKLLHPQMVKHGIVAFPTMQEAECDSFNYFDLYGKEKLGYIAKVWVSVKFFNSDDPLDILETRCFGYALDSGDKAIGKAYSMALKYCYLKTFMLESCDKEESRLEVHSKNSSKIEGDPFPSSKQKTLYYFLLSKKYGKEDVPKGLIEEAKRLDRMTMSKKIDLLNKELNG